MAISSQGNFQAAFDREAQSLWGVSNAYQTTIDVETTFYGAEFPALDPLGFGPGTWLLIPLMLFWLLYPNWGATLYGEVRGAGDFRKVLIGMLGGIWVATFLAIVFVLLSAKTFGWDFFQATNVNYLDPVYAVEGAPAPVIPIWSYPMMLGAFLVDNRIIQIIIVVLAGAWFLGWAGTLFLSSTRMIFAAAFDRILPEQAARVSDRGVPWVALLLIMIPSVVLSWFYAFNSDFVSLTLDATLVIAVTFLGSAFAATILPWWKKDALPELAARAHERPGLAAGQHRRGDHHDLPRMGAVHVDHRPERAVPDRDEQPELDHLPGDPVRGRGDHLCRRTPLPANPGRRPRRDPRGDPGRLARRDKRSGAPGPIRARQTSLDEQPSPGFCRSRSAPRWSPA